MLLPVQLPEVSLPDELLPQILQHLPSHELLRLSLLSKQWNRHCRRVLADRRSLTIGPLPVFKPAADKLSFMTNSASLLPSTSSSSSPYPVSPSKMSPGASPTDLGTDFRTMFIGAQRRYRCDSSPVIDGKLELAAAALSTTCPSVECLTLYGSAKQSFHLEQFIDSLPGIWPGTLTTLTLMNVNNNNNNSLEWSKLFPVLENLPNLTTLSIDDELPVWEKCAAFPKLFNRLVELNSVLRISSPSSPSSPSLSPLPVQLDLPYDHAHAFPNIRFGLWLEYESSWNTTDPFYDVEVEHWDGDSILAGNLNRLRIKLGALSQLVWLADHCPSLTSLDLTLYESEQFYRSHYLELYRTLARFRSLESLKLQFYTRKLALQRQITTERVYRDLRPIDLLLMTSNVDRDGFNFSNAQREAISYKEKPDNVQNLCQRDVREIGTLPEVKLLQIDFYIDPYQFAWIPTLFSNRKLMVRFMLATSNISLREHFQQIRHELPFRYQSV